MKASKSETPRHRKVRIVAPYAHIYSMKVKQADEGKTVLRALADKLSFRTEQEWKQRIADGFISKNGRILKSDEILSPGETLSLYNDKVTEPAAPDEVEIIAETADWLAVYKPAPMPAHPGGRYFKNTLTGILSEMGYENLHIIHRLDAVTSGLMLLGKNPEFTQKAQKCFAEGKVEKKYLALVSGIPQKDEFEVDKPIRRKKSFVFETSFEPGNKSAKTRFEVIERNSEKNTSLLACYPETGRTHQIRLHLLAAGFPITDDYIYNRECENYSEHVQHAGISLINAELHIPSLSVSLKLPERFKNFDI